MLCYLRLFGAAAVRTKVFNHQQHHGSLLGEVLLQQNYSRTNLALGSLTSRSPFSILKDKPAEGQSQSHNPVEGFQSRIKPLQELISQKKTKEAVGLYEELRVHARKTSFSASVSLFEQVLQTCSKFKLKELGNKAFQDSMDADFSSNRQVLQEGIQFFVNTGSTAEIFRSPKVHNEITYTIMLSICSDLRLEQLGKEIYQKAITAGYGSNIRLLNSSILFFGSVGLQDEAQHCFDLALKVGATGVTYNSWLKCLINLGKFEEAVELFKSMKEPNEVTAVIMMSLCSKHHLVEFGQEVYKKAIAAGFGKNIRLLNASISFFGGVEMLDEAQKCFEKAREVGATVVTYNAWLQTLINSNKIEEAIKFFRSMSKRKRTKATYALMMSMCTRHNLKEMAEEVHQGAKEGGFETIIVPRGLTENK